LLDLPHQGDISVAKDGRAISERSSADDGETVDLNLNAEVVAFFQATGPGWQVRMNAALRQFIKRVQ
jgi:uncharacterized protein (DUF4415 family)